jgi:hypothetical protein
MSRIEFFTQPFLELFEEIWSNIVPYHSTYFDNFSWEMKISKRLTKLELRSGMDIRKTTSSRVGAGLVAFNCAAIDLFTRPQNGRQLKCLTIRLRVVEWMILHAASSLNYLKRYESTNVPTYH